MYEMRGLVESGYERVVCRRSKLARQVVNGGGSEEVLDGACMDGERKEALG